MPRGQRSVIRGPLFSISQIHPLSIIIQRHGFLTSDNGAQTSRYRFL